MYRESESRRLIFKRTVCVWTVLLVFLHFQNESEAATISNKNLQAKVSGNHRRIMEPAFANSGKTPGLEIWRIEDFKPIPYPKESYGKFYSGDSYIILYTKENNGLFSWDIHFWLGTQTSQDEAGAAAILTVTLDDQLGGDPVQYREVQDHESQLFLSRFKSGIRYLPGGVSSGFTHVDRNAFEKRLFQVKGKRNIRVKQVDLTIAAMNKGDCFILDAGNDIYVYVGVKSKHTERLKAISAANLIRDQDHGGRSRIHVIDEHSSEFERQSFFTTLGGNATPEGVPDETAGGDDEQFENTEQNNVILYSISDRSGSMEIRQIGQKPLKQQQLDTTDCFILDTINANIFVWIGKQCNKKEKDEAMSKAQNFLQSKHYPGWTHVERIVEGAEPSIFRQYFQTWQGYGELHPRIVRSAVAKATPLAEKSGGEVPEFMPDDATGDLEIYRIENFELVPVDLANYGKFFGGDSYVIKYHGKNGKWIIYYWQGNKSSIDEKAASAIHAVQLDDELGGKAIQVRVVQDHEPKHFLHLFKGKLITFLGGNVSGFKNIKEHDTYVEGATRLYRVRGTNAENVRASQQLAVSSSLASDDVFIIENGSTTWLWHGKNCDDIEKELASGFVERLSPGSVPVIIEEGEEPPEFWDALGGRTPYNKNFRATKPVVTETTLYHCYVSNNGSVRYEEIRDFEQDDLDDDDIMVLDSTEEVYVWFGKGATEHERKNVLKNLSQMLRRYHRENAVIITVKDGEEPELFMSLFSTWEIGKTNLSLEYDSVKQKLKQENESIAD